jgi:hypothetical protein
MQQPLSLGAQRNNRSRVVSYGREAELDNIDMPPKQLSLLLPGQDNNEPKDDNRPKTKRPSRWHELMARAFEIDVLECDACGGRLQFIDSFCETEKIEEVLSSLGMADATSQSIAARAPPKPRDNGPLFERLAQ